MARPNSYRLRVQPVRLGPYRNFQVRIGMAGDSDLSYIPLHRSAFSQLLHVEVAHADKTAAELEAQMVAELLQCMLRAEHAERPAPVAKGVSGGAPNVARK